MFCPCDIITKMKFIDSTLKDNLTRDRLRMGASIAAVVALCLLMFMCIYTLLDSKAREERARRNAQADVLMDQAEAAAESARQDAEESLLAEEMAAEMAATSSSEETVNQLAPNIASETEQETNPIEQEETTPGGEGETQTEETAATTTADPNAVEEFYAVVYASGDINLRTGPGTEYDIVRLIHVGERIDVTGRTGSGWYRTYSGNFVLMSLTSEEPVATTAAATSATTAAATTAAQTTQPRPTTPPNSEGNTAGSADTSGMTYYGTCHITFYGPQPLSDGSWSTTTATGTSCSEGRTVAADWSIFPAGTTIYIPNDPLGGDGYYTVEDRGPGVTGSHIDIFANGSHVVTDCDVYIVN